MERTHDVWIIKKEVIYLLNSNTPNVSVIMFIQLQGECHKTCLDVINVLKTSFIQKDVICTLCMSQRRLLNVINVLKTSFIQKDVICTLCMSRRRLLNVMNVLKTSFIQKDVVCTLCMSQRRLLNVMDVFRHTVRTVLHENNNRATCMSEQQKKNEMKSL